VVLAVRFPSKPREPPDPAVTPTPAGGQLAGYSRLPDSHNSEGHISADSHSSVCRLIGRLNIGRQTRTQAQTCPSLDCFSSHLGSNAKDVFNCHASASNSTARHDTQGQLQLLTTEIRNFLSTYLAKMHNNRHVHQSENTQARCFPLLAHSTNTFSAIPSQSWSPRTDWPCGFKT